MIRRCGWCKKIEGEKEPLHDKSITDGICQACQIQLLAKYGIGEKHDAT